METVRILIIEDEATQRKALEEAIDRAFKTAPNPEYVRCDVNAPIVALKEAVERILENFVNPLQAGDDDSLPDLVIIDWKLEGAVHPDHPDVQSGMDIFLSLVAPVLLKHPAVETRFVVVTAYMQGAEENRQSHLGEIYGRQIEVALDGELFDFWRKPFSDDAVQSTLESMFELPSRWVTDDQIGEWSLAFEEAEETLRERTDTVIASTKNKKPTRPKGQGIHTIEYSNWTEKRGLWNQELRALEHQKAILEEGPALPRMLGRSECVRRVITQSHYLSKSNRKLCVLIQGKTGTGKELAARLVHDFEHLHESKRGEWSLRENAGKFFDVNCAAFSDTMLQSQLFGHVKGSFTGADNDRKGLFELADGGTVFLDEIGESGDSFKSMLLRFLETRRVTRVGEEGLGVPVNVRVILATDRDLESDVQAGKVSEAFYRRISALNITIDPLRTRREDIPMLAVGFWKKSYEETYDEQPSMIVDTDDEETYGAAFTEGAMSEIVYSFDWPGNVRQLRSVIETSVAIAGKEGSKPLTRAHVRGALGLTSTEPGLSPIVRLSRKREQAFLEELQIVERIWNVVVPGFVASEKPQSPGSKKTVEDLAHATIEFGTNFRREILKRKQVIKKHKGLLPYVHSYLLTLNDE